MAELTLCEGEASPDELESVFGVREMPPSEVTDETIIRFNDPLTRVNRSSGRRGLRPCRRLSSLLPSATSQPGQPLASINSR